MADPDPQPKAPRPPRYVYAVARAAELARIHALSPAREQAAELALSDARHRGEWGAAESAPAIAPDLLARRVVDSISDALADRHVTVTADVSAAMFLAALRAVREAV